MRENKQRKEASKTGGGIGPPELEQLDGDDWQEISLGGLQYPHRRHGHHLTQSFSKTRLEPIQNQSYSMTRLEPIQNQSFSKTRLEPIQNQSFNMTRLEPFQPKTSRLSLHSDIDSFEFEEDIQIEMTLDEHTLGMGDHEYGLVQKNDERKVPKKPLNCPSDHVIFTTNPDSPTSMATVQVSTNDRNADSVPRRLPSRALKESAVKTTV